MKITTITYRRVKNLGNYESEALEATAEIDDTEVAYEAHENLRLWVLKRLGISEPPEEVNTTNSPF